MSKSVTVAGIMAFTAVAVTGFCMALKADWAEAENVGLKAEIVEWQQAAVPAIGKRGWWTTGGTLRSAADLKPEHLKYALDPCYTTPAGNRNDRDCRQPDPPGHLSR